MSEGSSLAHLCVCAYGEREGGRDRMCVKDKNSMTFVKKSTFFLKKINCQG